MNKYLFITSTLMIEINLIGNFAYNDIIAKNTIPRSWQKSCFEATYNKNTKTLHTNCVNGSGGLSSTSCTFKNDIASLANKNGHLEKE